MVKCLVMSFGLDDLLVGRHKTDFLCLTLLLQHGFHGNAKVFRQLVNSASVAFLDLRFPVMELIQCCIRHTAFLRDLIQRLLLVLYQLVQFQIGPPLLCSYPLSGNLPEGGFSFFSKANPIRVHFPLCLQEVSCQLHYIGTPL